MSKINKRGGTPIRNSRVYVYINDQGLSMYLDEYKLKICTKITLFTKNGLSFLPFLALDFHGQSLCDVPGL